MPRVRSARTTELSNCVPAKPFACQHAGCNATFAQKAHLQTHQLIHDGIKNFICDFPDCDSAFYQKSNLKTHMRIHDDAKRFTCSYPECTSAFKHKNALENHMRTHDGLKPYACQHPGCTATFTSSANVTSHMASHSDARPFVCTEDGCTSAFKLKSALVAHMLRHTGSRPFACEHADCSARFFLQTDLTRHVRTHTGERPFRCPMNDCNAAFSVKCDLTIHLRTHSGERPYICLEADCNAAFISSSTLKNHKYYYHTPEGQQTRKREEERIAKLLTKAGINFKREHHVTFSCMGSTYARVDFMLLQEGKVIVIEIDEDQHFGYGVSCDVVRMCKLYEAWCLEGNSLPVRCIRYNPHAFKVDGKTKRTTKAKREEPLLQAINDAAQRDGEGLQIQYMFYDIQDGQPVILSDKGFTIGDCVIPSIY